jgi:hypothetical protein
VAKPEGKIKLSQFWTISSKMLIVILIYHHHKPIDFKERNDKEGQDVDGRIILNWILQK